MYTNTKNPQFFQNFGFTSFKLLKHGGIQKFLKTFSTRKDEESGTARLLPTARDSH